MATFIEWVLNPDGTRGVTINSKTGCLNHDNGMCKGGDFPCYAYRLSHGRLESLYLANKNVAPYEKGYSDKATAKLDLEICGLDPFYPRFWPERLGQIRKLKKPTGIFLDDMSDWMGDYWPKEWTEMELQVMRDCPQHRFYTLTKQPQNLIKWSPFPPNCWVGVTATSARYCLDGLRGLEAITAKVKFISFEPLLDYISGLWLDDWLKSGVVDWVIIGAQTKPYKPPLKIWVDEITEAADKAGVKVFLKDNLKPMFGKMTPKEAIRYGDLNKPHLIEEIAFVEEKGLVVAHKLRQELPC